jgi:glycosidase
VFLFEGDELGVADVPTAGPERDRNHRDPFRAPMVWDSAAEHGAFSTAQPWLTPVQRPSAGAVQQSQDADSPLAFTRRALALRSRLASNETQILKSEPGVVALQRGEHIVAVNLSDEPTPAPMAAARLELEARPGDGGDLTVVPAHGGWVASAV